MEIIFHLGLHATDNDLLISSVQKNDALLAQHGAAAPAHSRYRGKIRDKMNALKGNPAEPSEEADLLEAMVDRSETERLILSNENFICVPPRATGEGVLYPRAQYKIKWMRQLFPSHEVEFFLAIQNPATFLPAIAAMQKSVEPGALLDGGDPNALRWSETLRRLTEFNPGTRFTVWCNEDSPFLWETIIRELGGLEALQQVEGRFDMLTRIMSPDGFRRFEAYLATHPAKNETHLRRMAAAFLDKFAVEEEMEIELDLPGWTDELIEEMTDAYEADLDLIAQLPGVELLLP